MFVVVFVLFEILQKITLKMRVLGESLEPELCRCRQLRLSSVGDCKEHVDIRYKCVPLCVHTHILAHARVGIESRDPC